MRKQNKSRGQALIIIALALAGLVGIVGLVVDGGNAFLDRRKAQNAADAAVLAAALARIRGGQDMVATAFASAAQNGYNNDGVTNSVELFSPPRDGPHSDNVEYIQIIITSHIDTYFLRVVGRSRISNVVQAVARTKSSENKQLLNGMAIVSLAPSSNCGNQKSFWIHGDATLEISGGGVFINSNNETCALLQHGNGSIHVNDGFTINVVGGASIQKPLLFTPGVTVGAGPINYPPPFFMPDIECDETTAQVSADGITMTPGTWADEFPPQGVTQLEAGVYCLENGMKINGPLVGQNVVFKVLNGEVDFGNANIVLEAPNSGDNAGLLIYLPQENNSKVTLNGGSESVIEGTILAPASPIVINGNSSSSGFQSQIIGYTIEVGGSANVALVYSDAQNYDSWTMPEVQLSE
ncbi:MAG TPA: pilus assembly protein TadG-related protein [Anaerolineales bacterium]|nr:pilus assembly protein TadG-related protein [Anaerolineales bacterium]